MSCIECGKRVTFEDAYNRCPVCEKLIHKDCVKKHTHMIENPSLRRNSAITKRGETWKFKSFSSRKDYTVTLWYEQETLSNGRVLPFKAGYLTCDCPAWVFQKKSLKERKCKHTREVEKEVNPSGR